MQDLVGFFHACRNHYSDEKNLTQFYSQVYSQNGEDGMIAEVFRRIGTTDRFFVEIGVENGLQCNTRFLLETGWTGVWIEGDRTRAAEVSKLFAPFITANRLKILHAFVSAESVNPSSKKRSFRRNSTFSRSTSIRIPRTFGKRSDASSQECPASNITPPFRRPARSKFPMPRTARWDGTNWFGAGLKAIEQIGTSKGLHLVGCDYLGVNAFLVAKDEDMSQFQAPFTAEFHYEPPKYQLTSHTGHRPSPIPRHWAFVDEL